MSNMMGIGTFQDVQFSVAFFLIYLIEIALLPERRADKMRDFQIRLTAQREVEIFARLAISKTSPGHIKVEKSTLTTARPL